jgi:hypothetical protein
MTRSDKPKQESTFTVVELTGDGKPATQPRLDCTPETIQQIRGDFGKVFNNASLPTKVVQSESGPGYGSQTLLRYRGDAVVETHTLGYDEGNTMNEYSYDTPSGKTYFIYTTYEDHRSDIRTEIRRYFDNGTPCRCLRREGALDEVTSFTDLPDIQFHCARVDF